jgi:hypothetical protein
MYTCLRSLQRQRVPGEGVAVVEVVQGLLLIQHTSAYVSTRQHTSAYVSIREQTSAYSPVTSFHIPAHIAYVSIRQFESAYVSIRQHASAYVSIRQLTSAYVSKLPCHVLPRPCTSSIRQHTSAYVSIRQHTSAYVSICQHTSAYVSRCQHPSACSPVTSFHRPAACGVCETRKKAVSCFGAPVNSRRTHLEAVLPLMYLHICRQPLHL